jgi:hypothetical protein
MAVVAMIAIVSMMLVMMVMIVIDVMIIIQIMTIILLKATILTGNVGVDTTRRCRWKIPQPLPPPLLHFYQTRFGER